MKQTHDAWDNHSFQSGANSDADGEFVGRMPGTYRDAENMRVIGNEGGDGGLEKIRGPENIINPDRPGASTYTCIGAIFVKGHRVTFWASNQPQLYAPIIQVDGVTMAQSDQMPYVWDKKLQLHAAWECGGGTVFDARSGSTPLHWDIGDMIRAFQAGEQTYFSGIDFSFHQVNHTRPLNRPG